MQEALGGDTSAHIYTLYFVLLKSLPFDPAATDTNCNFQPKGSLCCLGKSKKRLVERKQLVQTTDFEVAARWNTNSTC